MFGDVITGQFAFVVGIDTKFLNGLAFGLTQRKPSAALVHPEIPLSIPVRGGNTKVQALFRTVAMMVRSLIMFPRFRVWAVTCNLTPPSLSRFVPSPICEQ